MRRKRSLWICCNSRAFHKKTKDTCLSSLLAGAGKVISIWAAEAVANTERIKRNTSAAIKCLFRNTFADQVIWLSSLPEDVFYQLGLLQIV